MDSQLPMLADNYQELLILQMLKAVNNVCSGPGSETSIRTSKSCVFLHLAGARGDITGHARESATGPRKAGMGSGKQDCSTVFDNHGHADLIIVYIDPVDF
jgi:hypothetical protein